MSRSGRAGLLVVGVLLLVCVLVCGAGQAAEEGATPSAVGGDENRILVPGQQGYKVQHGG